MVRENRTNQINVRMSDTGRRILESLQTYYGLSQASVFEFLLREEARRLGIPIPGSGAFLRSLDESQKQRQREIR